MKKIFLILFLSINIFVDAQTINPGFYGQNLWFANYKAAPAGSFSSLPNWVELKESGPKLIRQGGHNFNYDPVSSEFLAPSSFLGYVSIVDDIREQGLEPMITIPFNGDVLTSGSIEIQAVFAANIVKTLNVVHQRNVKYFIIANEPQEDYTGWGFTSTDAHNVALYTKAFVVAMRNVDPDIKIIGPEINYNHSVFLGYLINDEDLGGFIPASYNNESTGQAESKPWLDYISYHDYAGYGSAITNRTQHIEVGYQRADPNFYIVSALPEHMKVMVDEFNLKLNGSSSISCLTDPTQTKCSQYNGSIGATSNYFDITTADPNSFLAGQFIIDMMAGMIQAEVETSNLWSSSEGTAHGFIHHDGTDYYRKPTYWHYWLMANYMKGDFYAPVQVKDATGTAINAINNTYRGLKAYTAKAGNYIAVMVMNQMTSNETFSLSAGGTASGSQSSNFAFGLGGSPASLNSYPTAIDAKSTYLLFFECDGDYLGQYRLKQADMEFDPDGFELGPTSNYFGTGPVTTPAVDLPSSPACLGAHTGDVTFNLSAAAWYKLYPERTAIPDGNDLEPGFYEVELSSTVGCGSNSVVFSVHENSPIADAGPDVSVCTSTSTFPDVGNDELPNEGGGLSYTWTGGASEGPNGDEASITGPGTFTQTVTESSCSVAAVVHVIEFDDDELMIKDNYEDIGLEPNISTTISWRASDIWCRLANDGLTNQHAHQEPQSSADCYIYVKVRNIGCNSISFDDTDIEVKYVDLTAASPSIVALGMSSGVVPFSPVTILPGEFYVVTVLWDAADVPNTTTDVHACLIAKINHSSDPLQIGTLAYNLGDNNQADLNVSIVGTESGAGIAQSGAGSCIPVLIGNSLDSAAVLSFELFEDTDINSGFLSEGKIRVDLGPVVYQAWVDGGMQGTGIMVPHNKHRSLLGTVHNHAAPDPYTIQVISANATISNIELDSNQFETIDVCFTFNHPIAEGFFRFDLAQKTDGNPNSGVGFDIHVPDCPEPNAGNDSTIFRLCQKTLSASPVIAGAMYLWRDELTGTVIDTGATITVRPMITTTYELEMRTPDGCIDFDLVTITVRGDSTVCRPVCGRSVDYDNTLLSSNLTLSNQNVVISGQLQVPNGVTLTIRDCNVSFYTAAGIKVTFGGTLEIENSVLAACDPDSKWQGIHAKGNTIGNALVTITGSTIIDAVVPVYMEDLKLTNLEQNVFADGTKALELNNNTRFSFTQNQFFDYDTVIKASNCAFNRASSIKRNYFAEMNKGIVLLNNDYDSLEIHCNVFADYAHYGIYSASTDLPDQGDSTEGAGNLFFSNSTLLNHQFRYDGVPINYYYSQQDSVLLIDTTFTASSVMASDERDCPQVGNYRVASAPEAVSASTAKKEEYSLNCIPNPAADHVRIVYELPVAMSSGEIRIMNMLGESVRRSAVDRGSNATALNCSDLKSGIYFYSLIIDGRIKATKKMVIAR